MNHYDYTPIKYTANFNGCKNDDFQFNFSYFALKHRYWVHIRTALLRQFEQVPTIYVLEQK